MNHASTTPNHEGAKNTKAHEARSVQSLFRGLRLFVVSRPWVGAVVVTLTSGATTSVTLQAHSGPPFPILSDRVAGAYVVSIWTDPDATDDRSAAGKFWVMLQPDRRAGHAAAVPAGTRVDVAIRPLDREGDEVLARAEPVNGDAARQFVALLMDHEGPFGVRVLVDGPLGKVEAQASTDATYDLRPRPILMVLFVMPFVLVGFVWGKLLIRRRMHRPGGR